MPSEPPSRQLQPDQNQPDLGERFPGCAKAIFCWHVLPPAVAEHQCIARLHGAIIRRGGRCQAGHPAAAAITHYCRDAAGLSMPNHEVSSPRSRQNFTTTVAPIGVAKPLIADTGSSCAETPRLNQCSNARRPSLLFCRGPKCGLCVQAANRTMLVNRVGARDAQRHGRRPAIYDSGRQSARDYGCRQRAGAR
jgi:hypothetical protein